MKRDAAGLKDNALKEVERLKGQEERLRQRRIALLRRELEKATAHVAALRRELRLLGDPHVARTAERIAWSEVYERLGPTFTAREMAEMTGARPSLVGTITHRWRRQGRITSAARGKFRKVAVRH